MVVIDGKEVRSERPFPVERLDPKLCIFEFVYFARPDTTLYGNEVHGARRRMGQLLATQAPVAGRPGDGRARLGGAGRRGIRAWQRHPLRPGTGQEPLHRPDLHRPDPGRAGQRGAAKAQSRCSENITGKRVIVVDDSIVRGTTTRAMVTMLRESGATEVHLRISSPPFRWPCYYGIDTPDRNELLASIKTLDEIVEFLDVDSLEYLTLDHLVKAIDAPGAGFCDACLTGSYPVPVPVHFSDPAALSGVAGLPA